MQSIGITNKALRCFLSPKMHASHLLIYICKQLFVVMQQAFKGFKLFIWNVAFIFTNIIQKYIGLSFFCITNTLKCP